MKKLYLLFLVLLVLFIPKTFAVTPYRLDQPVPELNNFTLREVFENRNIAMPDLTGKTEISTGVYRLYDANGVTIDYNIFNGQYEINGTVLIQFNYRLRNINIIENTYASAIYVSGSFTSIGVDNISFFARPLSSSTVLQFKNSNDVAFVGEITALDLQLRQGQVFTNYQFKLQLEKGSIATPYQVATDGPYSDIDVGEFNLTPEQIDMYYDYYLEAVEFENRGGISMEFFLISIFFMYILIMIIGYFTKSKYFYFAGSLLWLVPIFNYTNIFIITTSIIVFLIHLTFIFYSDKDDVFE